MTVSNKAYGEDVQRLDTFGANEGEVLEDPISSYTEAVSKPR
jgi:hypothetical protein